MKGCFISVFSDRSTSQIRRIHLCVVTAGHCYYTTSSFSQSGCDKVAACCKNLWHITVAFVIAALRGKHIGGRGGGIFL